MINKTYVINLKRRTDKKQHMESELAKIAGQGICLNHVFFEAVDGNNPEMLSRYTFNIPNWFDPNSGKAMTNGEVGCALSHWTIWQEVVELVESGQLGRDCQVLILEDDIIFLDDFMTKLRNYTDEIRDQTPYDLLYVHRKPLNLLAESQLSKHINLARKSYWTCGYIVTYLGAKKLVNSHYLDNLIPVDEFLPLMYGCPIFGFEKLYQNCEKLVCYAVNPSLLKLTGNAFCDSETFHSQPYTNNDTYIFDGKEFLLVYVGPCSGNSYQRFQYYNKLYAIPCLEINNENDVNTEFNLDQQRNLLLAELDKWSQEKLVSTLLLVISVGPYDQCNVLNIASPKEIVEKYLELAAQRQILTYRLPDDATNNVITLSKLIFCGWADQVKLLVQSSLSLLSLLTNTHETHKAHEAYEVHEAIIRDDNCNIIQDLSNSSEIIFNHKTSRILNVRSKNTPAVLYANGPMETILLNRIENYTGNNWNEYYGYRISQTKDLTNLPTVYLSVNLGTNLKVTQILNNLDYPRDLLTCRVNTVSTELVNDLVTYSTEEELYQNDLVKFLESNCDYYFFVNHDCVLTNPQILKDLLRLNKDVVAPMIRRRNNPNDAWTNFWGDLDERGYYRRSFDYYDIINRNRIGCWNVPYVSGVYLIKREILEAIPHLFTENTNMDIDMRMCYHLRESDVFMYVSNMSNYGYIRAEIEVEENVTLYDFLTQTLAPEKRVQWERAYLHPLYLENINNLAKVPVTELCDGIYTFPLFSERFCRELIEISEKCGGWSKGKDEHNDPRLGKNYYENVPTVDVQMFQLGLDKQWHDIVFAYVAPMAKVLYNNYKTKDINLAFVVKYHYTDQASLSPHHDSSSYTINVALNRGGGVDYDGGGCRFIRQNFVLKNQAPGMCCIHPGRLTAYHEGLPVTAGTRYILVSFIN